MKNRSKRLNNEKGSLALEQVLFIGAITLVAVGVYAFYNNLGGYFSNVNLPAQPNLTQPAPTATN